VNGDIIYYVIRGLENDAWKEIVPQGFPGTYVCHHRADIGGLEVMGKTTLRFHGQDTSTAGEYRACLLRRSWSCRG